MQQSVFYLLTLVYLCVCRKTNHVTRGMTRFGHFLDWKDCGFINQYSNGCLGVLKCNNQDSSSKQPCWRLHGPIMLTKRMMMTQGSIRTIIVRVIPLDIRDVDSETGCVLFFFNKPAFLCLLWENPQTPQCHWSLAGRGRRASPRRPGCRNRGRESCSHWSRWRQGEKTAEEFWGVVLGECWGRLWVGSLKGVLCTEWVGVTTKLRRWGEACLVWRALLYCPTSRNSGGRKDLIVWCECYLAI